MKHRIAQTNLQLYWQLHAAGYSEDDMAVVQTTYEFGIEIFAGIYLGSRKAFIDHGVGTASVLAQIGEPAEVVAAGLLHNIYWSGVFGDGTRGITPRKQAEVRRKVGEDVERYLERFGSLHWSEETVPELLAQIDELDDLSRKTLLIRLAEQVDHLLDAGIAFSPNADGWYQRTTRMLGTMIELSQRLGCPDVGEELRALNDLAVSHRVPASLRKTGDWHFAFRIAPRTHRQTWRSRIRERIWLGFGLRKSIRSLFQGRKAR